MSFPSSALAPGEVVSRHMRPHWRAVLMPVVRAATLVAVLLVGWTIVPAGASTGVVHFALAAVVTLLFLRFGLWPIIVWRATHIVLTSERVVLREGVMRVQMRDIPLNRLNEVSAHQSFIDQLFGSGTLLIGSDDGGGIQLDVPDVLRVQMHLNDLVSSTGHRRGADLPDLEKNIRQIGNTADLPHLERTIGSLYGSTER